MALLGRRVLRTDNYTLQDTSGYDDTTPPSTLSSWGSAADVADMDQELVETTGEQIHEGAYILFQRTPDHFYGAVVKIRPTYTGLEAPFLEMWTYSGTTWTKRRRIPLTNVFIGVPSDTAKIFDLRLDVQLDDVAAVWITMDPGGVGAPINRFLAIHLYGECDTTLVTPDPCDIDPDLCEDPPACLEDPEDCIEPPCEPFCGPPAPAPIPIPDIDFPTVDLCNPEEVEAFKDTLTPEQLAFFEGLLDASELPCLDETGEPEPDPTDVCLDPVTHEPVECDPDSEEAPVCTFFENARLQGPYTYEISAGTPEGAVLDFNIFSFNNATTQSYVVAHLGQNLPEVQAAYADAGVVLQLEPNMGDYVGEETIETVTITGLPDGATVGLRVFMMHGVEVDVPCGPPSTDQPLLQIPRVYDSAAAYSGEYWDSYNFATREDGIYPGGQYDAESFEGYRKQPGDTGTTLIKSGYDGQDSQGSGCTHRATLHRIRVNLPATDPGVAVTVTYAVLP